jgi:hypothetical protein
VSWDFEPDGDGTLVSLSAEVVAVGAVDRLLWSAVGRRVMERGFPAVLARLQSVIEVTDSGSVALSSPALPPTSG